MLVYDVIMEGWFPVEMEKTTNIHAKKVIFALPDLDESISAMIEREFLRSGGRVIAEIPSPYLPPVAVVRDGIMRLPSIRVIKKGDTVVICGDDQAIKPDEMWEMAKWLYEMIDGVEEVIGIAGSLEAAEVSRGIKGNAAGVNALAVAMARANGVRGEIILYPDGKEIEVEKVLRAAGEHIVMARRVISLPENPLVE